MHPAAKVDPRLYDFCETENQKNVLKAIEEHGGATAAARALGLHKSGVARTLLKIQKRAARGGHAPGHWTAGVAPGYQMGLVTVQRANGAVERTWERQHPETGELLARIREAVDGMKEEIPAARAFDAPRVVRSDLCTQYTITDYHFGELAHVSEGDDRGADWNLQIAEDLLVAAIEHLAAKSPDSEEAVLALLGDLLHFDGPDPVTPTHKHPLNAAGTQRSMVRVVVRSIRRVVQHLLAKHARVRIVVVEGNHDMAGTPWLQEILLTHYESDPRVTVSDNDLPFFAMRFGCNFLGFHHGHKKGKEKLPILFAAMFRAIWGQTTKGYIHCGHYHEADEKEHPGVKVIQHPTLQAPGNHSLRGGWISEREMSAIHYHAAFGQVGRDIVTPEMLAA